jgi:hypothetical protein
MSAATITPATTTQTVTEAHRCDRCGARAKVHAVLARGGELYFCAHHGRKHWAALTRQGADFGPTGS